MRFRRVCRWRGGKRGAHPRARGRRRGWQRPSPRQGVTGTWSVSRGQRAIRRPGIAEAPATLNCFSRCPGRCAAAFGRSGRKGSCPFIAFPRAVKAGAVCAQTRLFGLIGETWNPRRGPPSPSPGRDTGRLRLPGRRRPGCSWTRNKGREPRWPTGTRIGGLVTNDRCPGCPWERDARSLFVLFYSIRSFQEPMACPFDGVDVGDERASPDAFGSPLRTS